MRPPTAEDIKVVVGFCFTILTSWFGATAIQMYEVYQGHVFSLRNYTIRLFVAGVVGYIVEGFRPDDRSGQGSIIAISGVLAFQIMDIIIKKGPKIIEKITDKKIDQLP